MNILKSCTMRLAIGLMILNGIIGLTMSCFKTINENSMTGTWHRDTGTKYLFFDDSRYQQTDRPGEQWIWSQNKDKVRLIGNPERTWTVEFITDDNIRVIETDTFELIR